MTAAAPHYAPALDVCERIIDLHEKLRAEDTLAPAPEVDALFGQLVQACIQPDDALAASVMADPRIDRLRPDLLRLCSEGETELERAFAARVLDAPDPWAELANFPY